MPDVRKITIEYDIESGRIRSEYPTEPVLALGMLERVKAMIMADIAPPTTAPSKKIVGAEAFPGGQGIGRA